MQIVCMYVCVCVMQLCVVSAWVNVCVCMWCMFGWCFDKPTLSRSQALVKRTAQSGIDTSGAAIGQSPFAVDTFHHHSSLRRRLSSPGPDDKPAEVTKTPQEASKAQETLLKQIEVGGADTLGGADILVGGAGILVGDVGILVGDVGILVSGADILVGDVGILVGGADILVGDVGILVGGADILVGGACILVGGTDILVGGAGILVGGARVQVMGGVGVLVGKPEHSCCGWI